MSKLVLVVVASTVFSAQPALAQERLPLPAESATCVDTRRFHDGDTFDCHAGSGADATTVVRLAGIDAPESGQPYWRAARDHLRGLARPGSTVACHKADRYQRKVCRVTSPDGRDVGLELVREGLAWHYVEYAAEQDPQERKEYADAEAAARAGRVGLWAEPTRVAPWECRKVRRGGGRC